MIIQLILSLGLLLTLFYVATQSHLIASFRLLCYGVALSGGLLIWFPEQANHLAALLGVGRGADLVTYCWILVSQFIFINLHIKLHHQNSLLTRLVRLNALITPHQPVAREQPQSATSLHPATPEAAP